MTPTTRLESLAFCSPAYLVPRFSPDHIISNVSVEQRALEETHTRTHTLVSSGGVSGIHLVILRN